MKKLMWTTLFVAVAFITSAAWGTPLISIDENGTGLYFVGNDIYALPYDVAGTLRYQLPFTPMGGDWKIFEPGTTNQLSDVLRFNGDRIYVFSESEAGELLPDLADTGLPTTFLIPAIDLLEQGSEGLNWVEYTPLIGQPGYTAEGVTYYFRSDIPEPAMLGLLALGGLLIRKRKHA